MKPHIFLASLVAVGSTVCSFAQNEAFATDPSIGRLPELVVFSNPSVGRLPEFIVRSRTSIAEGTVGVLPEFAVYAKRPSESRLNATRSLGNLPARSKVRRAADQNPPANRGIPTSATPVVAEAVTSSPNS